MTSAAATTPAPAPTAIRAYNDPVIFKDDRVLRTLLRKESRYLPACSNYFQAIQTEIQTHMRKEVADWMLEICLDQSAQPEVFCLAMNYFDRFLSVCAIARSQLQLLGAVCLLVAWKVREHEPLPAIRLVEYSDFNMTLVDIMEWEVLVLSKLDWDMSSVIASDFIEHIINRVLQHLSEQSGGSKDESQLLTPAVIRSHSETLITMCSAHHAFSSLAPSLVAAAAVLTTLRPLLELKTSTPMKRKEEELSAMDEVLDEVERVTMLEKDVVREVMDQIEVLMRSSLPPSPVHSPSLGRRQEETSEETKEDTEAATSTSEEASKPTPTKVLDAERQLQ